MPSGRDRDADTAREQDGERGTGRDRDAGRDLGTDRDRDAAGRARNARARDGLGRPLARGAPGEPPAPDEAALAPTDALDAAQRLLDEGRPFHAHEVLEASWKAAPTDERDFWQGLAQLAVGLTHARRGNAQGAAALLRRGADRVGQVSLDRPGSATPGHPSSGRVGQAGAGRLYGVDVTGLATTARELADRIDAAGHDGLTADQLSLRLRVGEPPAPD